MLVDINMLFLVEQKKSNIFSFSVQPKKTNITLTSCSRKVRKKKGKKSQNLNILQWDNCALGIDELNNLPKIHKTCIYGLKEQRKMLNYYEDYFYMSISKNS